MKKYCLTSNAIAIGDGRIIHQIKALVDIPEAGVKAEDLGGWIEKEANLSHRGECWVYGNAKVYDDAEVSDSIDG